MRDLACEDATPQQQWVHELDHAFREVFSLLAGRTCVPVHHPHEQASADASHLFKAGIPIVAEVAFSGTLLGVFVLTLARHSAKDLTRTLLNASPSTPLPDALLFDTVGELCNMVAGSWKARLAAPLSGCNLSPPTLPKASTLPRNLRLNLSRIYAFASHLLLVELRLA